ncbi:hypothetical protein NDU88_002370 [Pleurodeles waltl]|uniref:Uncharacterized protein n=1 Tax=Pleurodeles waltl TaxID=8319 RepID=A0AAV7VZG4_PLEWA|nr:hypothetical protein NDU88_002370 [Pleurodeles waltl]
MCHVRALGRLENAVPSLRGCKLTPFAEARNETGLMMEGNIKEKHQPDNRFYRIIRIRSPRKWTTVQHMRARKERHTELAIRRDQGQRVNAIQTSFKHNQCKA